MSNDGKLHVGLIACRDSVADVDDLVQRFPAELAALKKAVDAQAKPTPIKRKRKAAASR
jgi:diacylglycerol O-acyltransferase